jgi:hypothetical protein
MTASGLSLWEGADRFHFSTWWSPDLGHWIAFDRITISPPHGTTGSATSKSCLQSWQWSVTEGLSNLCPSPPDVVAANPQTEQ